MEDPRPPVIERVDGGDLGMHQLQPVALEVRRSKNGETAASGWMAEQTSWWKPGSVSSAVRAPPPMVSAPSSTSTERPASAHVMAAASPLGPAPTTTTSGTPPP